MARGLCGSCYRAQPDQKSRRDKYNAGRKEEMTAYQAAYYMAHREEKLAADAVYYDTHKKKVADRQRHRVQNDLNFRLKLLLRTRLYCAVRDGQKSGSAVRDLGCSIEHLKLHLELFWDAGMNWENYGHKRGQWSIDHIKPLSRFDLTDRTQFLEANHYMNLQPLWQIDNVRKGNRLQCQ